ncbi:GntR family transcriptional regulator [Tropicimonas sp. S265A]|uniref:GntR family transcriptional regulator n=1 Tax=Tropicimonas sp. S265A TaxID=3415134 RepID=UPI003C798BCC
MSMNARPIGGRRETLAGEVRGEIERMMVAGDLKAGEKLNELSLATAMGVSRGTVREAIRSLADSGLIDLIANRGAFVHETTLEEVRNLYDLRGSIFAMACAATARRVGQGEEPDLVAQLSDNLSAMQASHKQDDRAAYYDLNIAFHDMLLKGAGNPKAKTIYDNLVKEMHLFRRRGLSVSTNIAQSIAEHDAIVAAVRLADAEAARRAALDHIEAGFTRYMQLLEDTPVLTQSAG